MNPFALSLLAVMALVIPAAGFAKTKGSPATPYIPTTTAFASHIDAGATGFEAPKLSSDGSLVGWLVDFSPCCESYSVPMELVVMGLTGRLHVFSPPRSIVGWCFSKDSRAVAFSMTALHGPTDESFELHRVEDGKLLKEFDLPWKDLDRQINGLSSKVRIPAWAVCAATYPGQKAGTGQ
jgi:hypothetical protein